MLIRSQTSPKRPLNAALPVIMRYESFCSLPRRKYTCGRPTNALGKNWWVCCCCCCCCCCCSPHRHLSFVRFVKGVTKAVLRELTLLWTAHFEYRLFQHRPFALYIRHVRDRVQRLATGPTTPQNPSPAVLKTTKPQKSTRGSAPSNPGQGGDTPPWRSPPYPYV